MDGNWPRSIEFQIQEHDMGDLYALGAQIRRVEVHAITAIPPNPPSASLRPPTWLLPPRLIYAAARGAPCLGCSFGSLVRLRHAAHLLLIL